MMKPRNSLFLFLSVFLCHALGWKVISQNSFLLRKRIRGSHCTNCDAGSDHQKVIEEQVVSPEINRLTAKISELKLSIAKAKLDYDGENAELKKLMDEYGPEINRVKKEFARMKERSLEEATTISNKAKIDALKEVLPILDTYSRARSVFQPLITDDEIEIDRTYYNIFLAFNQIIEGFGVVKLESVGKPLDVNFMEAIQVLPSQEFDKDVVCVEYQAGYKMGNSCVRPAMVAVSSGPGPAGPSSE